MARIVIFGNSGSGKSTLAARLAGTSDLAHLDLDVLAWLPVVPPRRRPLEDSAAEMAAFMDAHDAWVIEGCYADLLALAAERCTRLIFLNPGVEACVANARRRPWEPHYGAYHAAEIQYLLGVRAVVPAPALDDDQERLSDAMVDYWTTFARTGQPNSFGRPFWPRYRAASQRVLSLAPPRPAIETDFAADHLCDFWAALGGP